MPYILLTPTLFSCLATIDLDGPDSQSRLERACELLATATVAYYLRNGYPLHQVLQLFPECGPVNSQDSASVQEAIATTYRRLARSVDMALASGDL